MDDKSLYPATPQSIGQVIDNGFRIYRQILVPMLPVSLVVALLSQAPELVHSLAPHPEFSFALVLLAGAGVLAWLIVYLAFYNGWIVALDALMRGQPALPLREVFARGAPTIGASFRGAMLYGLAVVAGCILLVIPGLYLMTALIFFWYFIVLEGMGGAASLGASRELVKGHWWRTLTVFSVAGLIYLAAFSVLLGVVAAVFGLSASLSGLENAKDTAPEIGWAVLALQAGANALLLPMWNTISLVMFRDLKLRKSGADLAARAASA
jgi:hypothetical protein